MPPSMPRGLRTPRWRTVGSVPQRCDERSVDVHRVQADAGRPAAAEDEQGSVAGPGGLRPIGDLRDGATGQIEQGDRWSSARISGERDAGAVRFPRRATAYHADVRGETGKATPVSVDHAQVVRIPEGACEGDSLAVGRPPWVKGGDDLRDVQLAGQRSVRLHQVDRGAIRALAAAGECD